MHSRRNFLKGIAATLALPSLDSFAAIGGAAPANPTRLAFVYIPNGVNLAKWMPSGSGRDFKLSESLQPLAGVKDQLSVIRHLDHDKAFANGDGAGDHARANATFLTGCQARKTAGANIEVGISVDQLAARQIGHQTRVPSLELSTDPPRRSGHCDSGYSCAYQYNLSWLDENTPAPAERDPRLVFEKLFGSGDPKEDARRRNYRKSILDFVQDDAKRMQRKLGASDRGKMDEYLTAVRDIEKRIENAERFRAEIPEDKRPQGIPESYREHIRLQFDLMALAFETDSTRISTFMLAYDGSNRSFPELGIHSGHHELSHHRGNPESLEKIAQIDRFYIEEFATFLERLKSTREGNGNLLDHSMIVYGGGIGDGNRHNHNDLPLILAGGGNGTLNPGRLIEAAEGTPMTNLYLSLLERMNVDARRIGDSTGVLQAI
ncbi:hypothetical protein HAHE_05560 [Haloferula helveola]|uniref:DUF1552 domain-containing protein n=1 Tax=Haloferula helveola TaxID=490095 RepID=A0ABN6H0Z3_9BACT|nr:hypothetical protein HAHE_05560 [Haloferula helveola]